MMKKLLLILSLLLPATAYADDLNLKVSTVEADLIWKGLRKLPVEEVENLMAKLRQQVMEQTTPKPVIDGNPKEPGKK